MYNGETLTNTEKYPTTIFQFLVIYYTGTCLLISSENIIYFPNYLLERLIILINSILNLIKLCKHHIPTNNNTESMDLGLKSCFEVSRVDQQTVVVARDPIIYFSLAYRVHFSNVLCQSYVTRYRVMNLTDLWKVFISSFFFQLDLFVRLMICILHTIYFYTRTYSVVFW